MVFLLCDQEVGIRAASRACALEGRLVRVAAAGVPTPAAASAALLGTGTAGRSTGRPRVVGGSTATTLRGAAAGVSTPAAATLLLATAAVAALTTATSGLGDLGRGVLEAGADFLDIQLVDRALDALTVLVGPLLQPALHDDAHASLKRLGDVLRRLTPDRAGEKEALAVLPLVGLTVEGAGGGRDTELRDRRTGRGEAQLGVVDKIADDRDDGLACHGGTSRRDCFWLLLATRTR
ncbi:hypothetical protein BN2537_8709 [Streptomyces venezuelae]|nr:hypothetical protein BN2537_8709 [Streptomyces venezuelae]